MGEQVLVPIWLLVIVGAGFTALVFAAWLFGRGDLRGALDMARDWETKATFAAIKEEAGNACRKAILALSVERTAFSNTPLELVAAHGAARSRPYLLPPALTPEPDPRIVVRPVIEHVDYINSATGTAPWAVDVKPSAVILDDPEPVPVPDGDRRVEDDDDGYPLCLQAQAASALRRQTRAISGDKHDNAQPGRHRLTKPSSDDTRQFTFRETLDAAVGEPS